MCNMSLHFCQLLFNAYICDLSYDINDLDFASFADVFGQLKGGVDKIFDWFKKIFLKEMLINVTYLLVQKLLWESRCQITL